jgi:hypothetical protein
LSFLVNTSLNPAEQPILPSHFDPRLDHLGERRLDAARRRGINTHIKPLAHNRSTTGELSVRKRSTSAAVR